MKLGQTMKHFTGSVKSLLRVCIAFDSAARSGSIESITYKHVHDMLLGKSPIVISAEKGGLSVDYNPS